MNDTELYQAVLGLASPWRVVRVVMEVDAGRVDIFAEHGSGDLFACSECRVLCPVYDHSAERTWRHLDTCQFQTILHAAPPRVMCPSHGVKQAAVPWAEAHARFTAMFECLAIKLMQACATKRAGEILKLSWDESFHIMEKAVGRGLKRKGHRVIAYIGVDEKAFAKRHKYLTLVYDLKRGTVEFIAKERKQTSLEGYFDALTPEQAAGLCGVAMDMWQPFIAAVCAKLKDGAKKIVFDPFHIIKHMNEAVDQVRRAEHKALTATGNDCLSKSRFLWLYGVENVPERNAAQFAALLDAELKTGHAWALKELLRGLWSCRSLAAGKDHLTRWCEQAEGSALAPVIKVANMIKRHAIGILNFFTHRISNGVSEATNGVIAMISRRAQGYRNPDHVILAIYFHCGGLDLMPQTHGNPG